MLHIFFNYKSVICGKPCGEAKFYETKIIRKGKKNKEGRNGREGLGRSKKEEGNKEEEGRKEIIVYILLHKKSYE